MERPLLAVAAVAAAIVVLAALAWPGAPDPPPLVMASPTTAEQATVHVSGEVADPGLVTVARGSRVADAIAAAGGATPDARLDGVNLAAPVVDGMHLLVPGPGGEQTSEGGAVRLNTASVSDIETLPGVGPVLAQRIADFRDENGPFASVEDLLDVAGIGEAKLAALRDAVLVP